MPRRSVLVALLAATVAVSSGSASDAAGSASDAAGSASDAAEAGDHGLDLCVEVGGLPLDEGASLLIVDGVRVALGLRPVLIPAPQLVWDLETGPRASGRALRIGVRTAVTADAAAVPRAELAAFCGPASEPGRWSAVISGAFLRAGTKRELAAAPTTPGFSSSIDVEWDEEDDRVRTVLTFSGPLDFPNGTCWMDDVVSADGRGGTRVETTTGSRTSPFGDGVCGRFEEYLAEGGAGAQALVLLPREVEVADGRILRLGVDDVDVRDGGVHLAGTVTEADA